VTFEDELRRVLPLDIPHRDRLLEKAARHLELVSQANEYMNLTRISSPREAAVKHILDCVLPWRHFQGVQRVLDAGTGAGFPGIPLAIILPEVRFLLAESIQKKARFVESVADALDLANVEVSSDRAESVVARWHPQIITARAVAPAARIVALFAKAVRNGSRLLLYKGPDVEQDLAQTGSAAVDVSIVERYDLPDELGRRTLLAVCAHNRGPRNAS
jgi:16S rRNA (guanine527-N7)-methyltransferase